MATLAEQYQVVNLVGPAVRVGDEVAPLQRDLSP
jgi:hypothetical protein